MKVAHRLSLLTGLLLLIAVLIGALGLYGMQQGVRGLNTVYQDRVVPLKDLRTMADLYAVSIVDNTHKAADGALSPALALQGILAAERQLKDTWQAYMATYLVPEEARLAQVTAQQMLDTQPSIDQLKILLQNADLPALQQFRAQKLYPAIDPIGTDFSQLIEIQLKVAADEYAKAASSAQNALWLTGLLLALGLVFGVAIAWRTIHTLGKQLGAEPADVVALANQIAQGKLNQAISLRENDNSSILAAIASMRSTLHTTMLTIEQSADHLTASAHQLASTSSQVMSSSEAQSDAAASMAAAVEELTTSIAQISDNAAAASMDSANSSDLAQQGERIMHETADDMQATLTTVQQTVVEIEQLSKQSQQITAIVQVIKDIADQTNLLALNPAIEAARAGDMGRGFAVVADEVRKLAERTGSSTSEIVAMINAIQASTQQASKGMQSSAEHMHAGAERAEQAGQAMSGIQNTVTRIGTAVHGIANALQEQRNTSYLVANNVERVAQMTEENSAATHNLNDSARLLMEMADSLKQSVAKFQLR